MYAMKFLVPVPTDFIGKNLIGLENRGFSEIYNLTNKQTKDSWPATLRTVTLFFICWGESPKRRKRVMKELRVYPGWVF